MARKLKLPGTKRPPFYVREFWPNLFGIGAVLAGVGAATKMPERGLPFYLVVAAALFASLQFGLKMAAAIHKDRETAREKSPLDLKACLHVLHGILVQQGPSLGADDSLRLTVHRLDRGELEQVVPYVGGRGGEAGRRMSIHTGIIGKCVSHW